MNFQNVRQWFERKREPDFTDAFVSHLQQRYGVSPSRFWLPRVRCTWRLITDHIDEQQRRNFMCFVLDGHAPGAQKLVTSFFRVRRHDVFHPADGGLLLYDGTAKILCAVRSCDHDRTFITIYRKRAEETPP
jgi:hypothetical protein